MTTGAYLHDDIGISQLTLHRQSYWTATFKNDAALQARIFAIFQEEIAGLKDLKLWLPTLVFQPFSKGLIEKFKQNGGNPFGMTTSDGPLIRKLCSVLILSSY